MKIDRDYVLAYLRQLEEQYGGYFGTDLLNLAKELNVTLFGLKKVLNKWLKEDSEFASLNYLGIHKPAITPDEFMEMEIRRNRNPLEVKKYILDDINKERNSAEIPRITKRTFYRGIKQFDKDSAFIWFVRKNVNIPLTYSVADARNSLSTLFTFFDLKTYGGVDIQAIYDRWASATAYFSVYEVDPILFYPQLLNRERQLRNLLTSIPPDRLEDVQARLTFEIQVTFLVECLDLLLEEIIHRRGRIQQSMNASRQKEENELRKKALESMRSMIKENLHNTSSDMEKLYFLSEAVSEDIEARILLLRRHKKSYQLILKVIENLVNTLGNDIIFHTNEGLNFYRLASGKTTWKYLDEITKRRLTRDPTLTNAIGDGNEDVAQFLAIDRLVEYIRHGKITFRGSYCFQDIGSRLKETRAEDGDGFLTSEILEQSIAGTFPVDISPLCESENIYEEIEDLTLPAWVDMSSVLKEVSMFVRETTPGWFDEHIALFKQQTDGMFDMEYTEEEFAERLYEAIGFLGRNLRYRDSEKFWNLRYFIQRYVTEAALRLEFRFIHRCMERLSGNKVEAVILDTIGIEGRKKSILATYHGRYHTIGMADLRAVSVDMLPVFSCGCRSTDTEAMNVVEVIKEAQEICNRSVKIYSGNGHTTSRVAAGMVFLSFGVVAAGRILHKPTKPLGKKKIARLRKNINLLNHIGKLLREEPTLGRVIASRKHIYVDGVNVRKLIEDMGYLILYTVGKLELPINDLSQTVEKSNYLKRKARIVEGSITRVERHEANILLKSSELLLCIAGLYHMLKGWKGAESPVNLSDIRLFIPA
jgi:hypothetical protein